MGKELLKVEGLQTYFFHKREIVRAVDGVSFSLHEGESMGIVGESGCGKTMTALSIVRLVPKPAGRTVGGKIIFDGEDILKKSEPEMRAIRGQKIAMIMQDPTSSLNPVFTISNQLLEAFPTPSKSDRSSKRRLVEQAIELLHLVRIPSPESRLRNYPHELSGGMKQRVVGAIALAGQPKLIIADEPTTSLDVTIQEQYLALLKDIQKQSGTALLFITHDFGIVARVCDWVTVMYAGQVVERASVWDMFDRPKHPYTRALIHCVPTLEKRMEKLASISGQPPALDNLPPGCRFSPRCDERTEKCRSEPPEMREIAHEHFVRCWVCE